MAQSKNKEVMQTTMQKKQRKPLHAYSPRQRLMASNYVEAVQSGKGVSLAEIKEKSGYSPNSGNMVLNNKPIRELIEILMPNEWLTQRTFDNAEAAPLGTQASTSALTLMWKLKGELQEGSRTNVLNVGTTQTNIDIAGLEKLAGEMAKHILSSQLNTAQ